MESTFEVKFTLVGAPPKSDYKANIIEVFPNAPPRPTQAISTVDTSQSQRSFSLTFPTPLSDGDHPFNDQSVRINYREGTDSFTAKDIGGNIKINGLEGTYNGNFTATLIDTFEREWKAEGNFVITVIPQKY